MTEQTEQRYKGSIGGYQAVVGPKDASQLELVLNTIFNVGEAPALFPLQVAIDLREGKVSRRGQVRYAIPQARGDSVSRHAFPVVATIDEMFTKYEWQKAPLVFAQGAPFEFGMDVGKLHAARLKHNKEVIEQISALGDERRLVACNRGDDGYSRLFAELLRAFLDAFVEELVRIGFLAAGASALGDDFSKLIEIEIRHRKAREALLGRLVSER